jgi:hypothetical protein
VIRTRARLPLKPFAAFTPRCNGSVLVQMYNGSNGPPSAQPEPNPVAAARARSISPLWLVLTGLAAAVAVAALIAAHRFFRRRRPDRA